MDMERVDEDLEDLLEQPFETDHGIVPTREASIREIRSALDDLGATRARLLRRADRSSTDDDALGHVIPRIAALSRQIDELLVALDWCSEARAVAEPAAADRVPRAA